MTIRNDRPKLCDGLLQNPVLREIIESNQVTHPDGRVFKLSSGISTEEANALYGLVREQKPDVCIEIGMAYGISTLTILTGLEHNGVGSLISIDPYEGWESGMAVALANVERAGYSGRHRHIRLPSYLALPKLIEGKTHAQLCYIDGMHTFDHAFLDFFYSDKLLEVGGVVGFDDAGWRSVWRVIRFLLTHRHYQEIDVGLQRTYRGRNVAAAFVKWLTDRQSQNRFFRKLDTWEPPFSYYRHF
jgi:predicted O-methyltransferase YrrM